MNRRRLCQLTAAILTSDLTTHIYVGFMISPIVLSNNGKTLHIPIINFIIK